MQLTFATADVFKHIHSPVFEDASKQKVDGQVIERAKRATWRLRRCGRVRMPYAAALLDLYTSVMSRQAFDLDFMSTGLLAATAEEEKAEPQTAVTRDEITMPVAEDQSVEPIAPQDN